MKSPRWTMIHNRARTVPCARLYQTMISRFKNIDPCHRIQHHESTSITPDGYPSNTKAKRRVSLITYATCKKSSRAIEPWYTTELGQIRAHGSTRQWHPVSQLFIHAVQFNIISPFVTLERKLYEANVIVRTIFGHEKSLIFPPIMKQNVSYGHFGHAKIALFPQILTFEARIATDGCFKMALFPPCLSLSLILGQHWHQTHRRLHDHTSRHLHDNTSTRRLHDNTTSPQAFAW